MDENEVNETGVPSITPLPSRPVAGEPLVSVQVLTANRILVINSKGGAGKTTVATNLSAWLARKGATALVDADPQGSSHHWCEHRPNTLPPVYGIKVGNNARLTRSFQWRAPRNTQWLITDAPPGLTGPALDDMVLDHDLIVIPVLPSDIDIRASARFIGELLLCPAMRKKRRPIAVIANRVKQQTKAWERLQKFLLSLNIPFVGALRDTQNYVRLYGEGLGVCDGKGEVYGRDRDDWNLLLLWLDAQINHTAWPPADLNISVASAAESA